MPYLCSEKILSRFPYITRCVTCKEYFTLRYNLNFSFARLRKVWGLGLDPEEAGSAPDGVTQAQGDIRPCIE